MMQFVAVSQLISYLSVIELGPKIYLPVDITKTNINSEGKIH